MKKASVLIMLITIVLSIGIISVPVSAQDFLGVVYHNYSDNPYLFWYPTLNGIRVSELNFYKILHISEEVLHRHYENAAINQAIRIQENREINDIIEVSVVVGSLVGAGVVLGGLIDTDNNTDYFISGSVLAILSMIPLFFIQDTSARNIVSYEFAKELANRHNRR